MGAGGDLQRPAAGSEIKGLLHWDGIVDAKTHPRRLLQLPHCEVERG